MSNAVNRKIIGQDDGNVLHCRTMEKDNSKVKKQGGNQRLAFRVTNEERELLDRLALRVIARNQYVDLTKIVKELLYLSPRQAVIEEDIDFLKSHLPKTGNLVSDDDKLIDEIVERFHTNILLVKSLMQVVREIENGKGSVEVAVAILRDVLGELDSDRKQNKKVNTSP